MSSLFNIFLERIMADALEDHESSVSVGFADDIGELDEQE